MTTPESFDPRSHDAAADRLAELLRLFPEVQTEGGKLDFDRLKLALGEAVDVGKERYGLSWPGKAECFRTIQAASLGTLLPRRDESVNFDSTENLIIEGDNLEVLKLLQKSYLGQVKMIYIDPPYNTGNDFIYPDNYTESLKTYLQYTGQVDAEGRKFGTNPDTDGRFHSKWLNMMYPRLYLARNLLREDGVIFISIDISEVDSLKALCAEVFGPDNLVAMIAWQNFDTTKNDAQYFSSNHEYVLCYAKRIDRLSIRGIKKTEKQRAYYKNRDDDPRGDYLLTPLHAKSGSDSARYTYVFSNGQAWTPPPGTFPRFSKETLARLDAEGRIYLDPDGEGVPQKKTYWSEVGDRMPPPTFWEYETYGSTRQSNAELAGLVGKGIFPNPKPTKTISTLIDLIDGNNGIVLDFFAGSGTTAHAVLSLNASDGGSRRFILVQLPERLDPAADASKAGAAFCDKIEKPRTLSEITKERVRRAAKAIAADKHESAEDTGFRVFQLAESNFTTWDASVPHETEALVRQMELHVDHIREGRTEEDILFELLLKSGFPLSTTIEPLMLAEKTVYSIAGGALLVCLDRDLTLEAIRAIADAEPQRVILLDQAFRGNDQLKANAVQTFKTKGVVKFQTV